MGTKVAWMVIVVASDVRKKHCSLLFVTFIESCVCLFSTATGQWEQWTGAVSCQGITEIIRGKSLSLCRKGKRFRRHVVKHTPQDKFVYHLHFECKLSSLFSPQEEILIVFVLFLVLSFENLLFRVAPCLQQSLESANSQISHLKAMMADMRQEQVRR